MDTEKLKQMGRDYFAANPNPGSVPEYDDKWLAEWRQADAQITGRAERAGKLKAYMNPWLAGWNEARYAASKEGRAIELLGRLMQASYSGDIAAIAMAEIKAADFLQNIGWKPTP